MNKLLGGIILSLAVIALLLVNLTRVVQGPPKPLGNIAGVIQKVATSTFPGVYFGATGADRIRTSTTTLLTMGGLAEADAVSIGIISVGTTTAASWSPGEIYFQPEVSFDDSQWFPLNNDIVTNTGTFASRFTLFSGTTTFSWVQTGNVGTSTTMVNLGPINANWLRVKVWTTGTSTVSLEGYKKLTN